MRAEIKSILTTVEIDDNQVDICYDFGSCMIDVFVDSQQIISWYFTPSRTIYNHMNMIELAAQALTRWKKKKRDLFNDPFQEY
jgi:hypothetical protein